MALMSLGARLFRALARGFRRVTARLINARLDDPPNDYEGVPEHWLRYVRQRAPHLLRPGGMPPHRSQPSDLKWTAPGSPFPASSDLGPLVGPRPGLATATPEDRAPHIPSDSDSAAASASAPGRQLRRPAVWSAESRPPPQAAEVPRVQGQAVRPQETSPQIQPEPAQPARLTDTRHASATLPRTVLDSAQPWDGGTLQLPATEQTTESSPQPWPEPGGSSGSVPATWPGAFGPAEFSRPAWTAAASQPRDEHDFAVAYGSAAHATSHRLDWADESQRSSRFHSNSPIGDRHLVSAAPWPPLLEPDRDDFDWRSAEQAAEDERRLRLEQRGL
jgi:hypothetical protein